MGKEGTSNVLCRVKMVISSSNSALRHAVPIPVTAASGPAAVILLCIGQMSLSNLGFLHMCVVHPLSIIQSKSGSKRGLSPQDAISTDSVTKCENSWAWVGAIEDAKSKSLRESRL